ncbi:tRNA (mnm(5)s(2)U34)-methyltransferase, chloroplastic isoform X2 [Aegilops tauschii subsp. strangulata]|uniref:tRNA (mnm(5)s(2)U34)-methyltransferase, chloroplastic isoform X2 n=1 Tax=Aegilops tauschii subsp. strangulata TaxID=200361 RepID=UPI001ABD1E8D
MKRSVATWFATYTSESSVPIPILTVSAAAAATAAVMPPPSLLRPPLSLLLRRSQTPSPLRRIPSFTPSPLLVPPKRRHLSAAAAQLADPLSAAGAEEAVAGFVTGKRKATEVAHAVWRSIVQKGDAVVDATCGNGNDTFALLKMVSDDTGRGRVYGMDIQDSAIDSTSSFLKMAVDSREMELVKLFAMCHSRMEDIVPKDSPVRLVAFNLGYLPGGDKKIITVPETTELALQAASRIVGSGGLISVLVYIGHLGGRDELDIVESFASRLPVDTWVSCKFEMINRPVAPVLVLLHKK